MVVNRVLCFCEWNKSEFAALHSRNQSSLYGKPVSPAWECVISFFDDGHGALCQFAFDIEL